MKETYLRKLKIELVDGDFKNRIKKQVGQPKDLYNLFKGIKDNHQETSIGVYMLGSMVPSAYSVLSVGSPFAATYEPREFFGQAYVLKASHIAMIHNHPSGNPIPSPNDRRIIKDLQKRCEALDIWFVDFIIVGAKSYWSWFNEQDQTDYSVSAVKKLTTNLARSSRKSRRGKRAH